MPARGKDLTNEEREWLRTWAYALREKRRVGLDVVAAVMQYATNRHVSRVLNDEEGGAGFQTGAWRMLLAWMLRTRPADARFFEHEAASTETRREIRTLRDRARLRAEMEAEMPHGGAESQAGVVMLSAA